MKSKTFSGILRELDWPSILFVYPRQFAKLPGGWDIGDDAGGAIEALGVVTVAAKIRGKARTNTLWHELAHCLWGKKPEWWCYLFGSKMAGGGGTGWEWRQDGHTLSELPSRKQLLKLAIRAAKRYNAAERD